MHSLACFFLLALLASPCRGVSFGPSMPVCASGLNGVIYAMAEAASGSMFFAGPFECDLVRFLGRIDTPGGTMSELNFVGGSTEVYPARLAVVPAWEGTNELLVVGLRTTGGGSASSVVRVWDTVTETVSEPASLPAIATEGDQVTDIAPYQDVCFLTCRSSGRNALVRFNLTSNTVTELLSWAQEAYACLVDQNFLYVAIPGSQLVRYDVSNGMFMPVIIPDTVTGTYRSLQTCGVGCVLAAGVFPDPVFYLDNDILKPSGLTDNTHPVVVYDVPSSITLTLQELTGMTYVYENVAMGTFTASSLGGFSAFGADTEVHMHISQGSEFYLTRSNMPEATYRVLTNAPTTAAPTTNSPTTAAPTTESPTTATPTTASPTTGTPTTASPTTGAPTTASPTTGTPTTASPTTGTPTTATPTAPPTTRSPTLPGATPMPTLGPSAAPTGSPTTLSPTTLPSASPTTLPSASPTVSPSAAPTGLLTSAAPSAPPTNLSAVTESPSASPTAAPSTPSPTSSPSAAPTPGPTVCVTTCIIVGDVVYINSTIGLGPGTYNITGNLTTSSNITFTSDGESPPLIVAGVAQVLGGTLTIDLGSNEVPEKLVIIDGSVVGAFDDVVVVSNSSECEQITASQDLTPQGLAVVFSKQGCPFPLWTLAVIMVPVVAVGLVLGGSVGYYRHRKKLKFQRKAKAQIAEREQYELDRKVSQLAQQIN